MVKVSMNTADVAAEVKCLRRLIGMRCSNVYDLSPKTYVFKLMNSSGITESGENEKVLLLIESGIRLHTTDYVRDKSNTPSGFTLKLRKHIRTRRLEDVRQLGYDRIVIFQFGLGADAHYVILELYALGNIILTDSDFMVLTLLRSHRDDDKRVAFMFRHHYPTEICQVFERTTAAKLHAAFTSREPDYNKPDKDTEGGTNEPDSSNEKQSSRKGGKSFESSKNSSDGTRAKQVTLKTVLGEALGYGQALTEHIILDGGLVPNTKISKENMLDDNTIHVLVQAVARFEDWLQDVISGDKIPEGYILMQKSGKEPGGSGQIYDEFCPILLNQFRLRENVKFDTFDAALDEFYSKIESQWSEQQQKAKESSANQKLNKICLDQKCYKGRKEVEAEHSKVREQFYGSYGKQCQNVDRQCFGPESDFFQQLFFFFNAHNVGDCLVLVETCRLLQQFVQHGVSGCVTTNTLNLFAAMDYSCKHSLVDNRVKQLSFSCIWATHQNRNQLKDQLLISPDECSPTTLLLETVVLLIDPKLPWACKIIGYLMQRNAFALFRDIVLTAKESAKSNNYVNNTSSLERVLALIVSHTDEKPCICPVIDPEWNFSSQILTVPFLWQLFPCLKEVFATRELSEHYVHQMAICVKNHATVLPNDTSAEFPGCVCLLGNILEIAGVALSQPDCSFEMARDFAAVATLLLEALPQIKSSKESSTLGDDAMDANDDITEIVLNSGLEKQISNAIDPRFLLQLTNVLFRGISLVNGSQSDGPNDREVAAVGAACAFLHVTFNTLPLERIMTILAYRTELVPVLWNFIKRCHKNKKWSSLSQQLPYLPGDAPGWLLPLSVFCPVYKHMLTIVDNEEFYEQEKPLSLKDIKCLIVILRQALWQVLWSDPEATSSLGRLHNTAHKRNPVEFIQYRVSIVASDLLSQLQDWNNRRQFAPPSDFHADGVHDSFIYQAVIESTRAHDILKQAPFLIPFTSRVKIFASQLAAVRQRHGSHAVFTGSRFKIRRDHILEDAYNQMSDLSEEDLRGLVMSFYNIRVTFVNELGVEEAGIDGGGIFKDFMENIARAAFDVQYGLFKETADHLLFPNPGSGMIHEQHLQFFHFLGTLLSKAMFEGILVDIPFATFFLSKLKQKYNYLNDLPSLDPELYRHLIFLKHFEGDISELELYFVIVNNEYGEQTEEELLPGGKNIRVTNENVITFIHLVANHRLNFQIRQQSSHFLRGFQQLIPKDWIVMFNEHELQLLISGSLDSLNVDDLRDHSNYAGGYHSEHHVIEMFWEVLKGFSLENQKKFLKFTTGCSRGPLLGFKYLEPIFCIQRTAGNTDEEALDRLPTSATCMNLLKLPPYRSKEQLEMKLMYAINAEAGFDLS